MRRALRGLVVREATTTECVQELLDNQLVLLSPTMLYTVSVQLACCAVAACSSGFSCGYAYGSRTIPDGLDRLVEDPVAADNKA